MTMSAETVVAHTEAKEDKPMGVKTPPRSSLAQDHNVTPIASIKRPRGGSNRCLSTPETSTRSLGRAETPLTPMHPAKNIHREAAEKTVNKIFSPALQNFEVESDDESMSRPQVSDEDEFNPWLFIKSLPPYETIDRNNKVPLPEQGPNDNRKTLVLDLDETLVHCAVDPPDEPADFTFPVTFHGVNYTVHVKKRPGLDDFLEQVSKLFEVVVFTASQKVYADTLLNLIDPEKKLIHHRLFRESCVLVEGNYLKDLSVVNRSLSSTILVDNSPHAFGYQVDNGIPIESWFEDPEDRELRKLLSFLRKRVINDTDVRSAIRIKFQSYRLVQGAQE